MNTAQKNATDYRTDLEKRRPDTRQAQLDRDRHFHGVVELTDERNQAADDKKLLQDAARWFDRRFCQGEEVSEVLPYRLEIRTTRTNRRPMWTAACWRCRAAG